MSQYPQVLPLGDSALLAVLGDGIGIALCARVARLASELRALALPGITSVVPAYASVAVHFESCAIDCEALAQRLEDLAARELDRPEPAGNTGGTAHAISVRYDGPDLALVADALQLTPSQVIERHAGRTYHVLFLGFVPGFAYLGPLDPTLSLPRRPVPRPRVASGSVAMAGEQTGIYPIETPGGWHLIGRTDATLFDPRRTPPNLFSAGDLVRFEPIR